MRAFNRAISRIVLPGIVAVSPLFCQAPLLRVSAASLTSGGAWQVTVANVYKSPVTAFEMVFVGGGGVLPGQPLARRTEDSIPGPAKSRMGLAPGESRVLTVGNARWQDVTAENTAVIYADGATAGLPAVVTQLISTRQREEADIIEVLPMLTASMRDSSIAQPAKVQALLQTFNQRRLAHTLAAQGGLSHVTDRVCASVVATLRDMKRQTPQQSLWALHEMFSRWLTQLQQVQPQAPPAAGK